MFGTDSLTANPFAAPAPDANIVSLDPELKGAEQVRHQFLAHEAKLRLVGGVYFFLAIICLTAAPAIFIRSGWAMSAIIAAFFALVFAWLGQALRQLNPAIVPFLTVFCALGLLLPFGLLIVNAGIEPDLPYLPMELTLNLYILYLVHSRRGRYVFSPEYREIRRATPEVRPSLGARACMTYGVLAGLAAVTTYYILEVTLGQLMS